MRARACVCVSVCVRAYVHACLCVCMCVCVLMCVCVCVCACSHCVGMYLHGFACMCAAVQSVREAVHVPGKPDTPLAHPHRRETLLLLGLWAAVHAEELPEPTPQDSHRLVSGLLVTLLYPQTRYNSHQSASGLLVTLLYPQRNQTQILSWCFTSTETIWLIRDGGRIG